MFDVGTQPQNTTPGPVARDDEARRLQDVAAQLAEVASLSLKVEEIRRRLDLAALAARDAGASWAQLARAAGIAPPSAQRRWDPVSRERHRDYQRERARRSGAMPGEPA